MKFKIGDNIVKNKNITSNINSSNYEVKDIAMATSDFYQEQYYILMQGAKKTFHDAEYIDEKFTYTLKHTLKNL